MFLIVWILAGYHRSVHISTDSNTNFAAFIGVRHAIAASNGTTALHLSLLAHDVGPGDEIIVPTLTYVASVNAIAYLRCYACFR